MALWGARRHTLLSGATPPFPLNTPSSSFHTTGPGRRSPPTAGPRFSQVMRVNPHAVCTAGGVPTRPCDVCPSTTPGGPGTAWQRRHPRAGGPQGSEVRARAVAPSAFPDEVPWDTGLKVLAADVTWGKVPPFSEPSFLNS